MRCSTTINIQSQALEAAQAALADGQLDWEGDEYDDDQEHLVVSNDEPSGAELHTPPGQQQIESGISCSATMEMIVEDRLGPCARPKAEEPRAPQAGKRSTACQLEASSTEDWLSSPRLGHECSTYDQREAAARTVASAAPLHPPATPFELIRQHLSSVEEENARLKTEVATQRRRMEALKRKIGTLQETIKTQGQRRGEADTDHHCCSARGRA